MSEAGIFYFWLGASADADPATHERSQSSLSSPSGECPLRWTREQVDALGADKGFLPAEYWPLRLVIIESPYAGDVEANVEYARAAMRDSLNRGEAPIASHLLYTQPGILRDEVSEERQWGIDAGLAWRSVADLAVFYIDRNWSGGMIAARRLYLDEGFPFEVRSLNGEVHEFSPGAEAA